MVQYSITVNIKEKALQTLKDNKRHFVFVRDLEVDGELQSGNIVSFIYSWRDLSATQTVIFEESFYISPSAEGFEEGHLVDLGSAPPVQVQRGQQADIQPNSTEVTGNLDPSARITVLNHWKPEAHLIISLKNLDGVTFTSYYISPPYDMDSKTVLAPTSSFSLFFTSETEWQTMIDISKSTRGHFQFEGINTDCKVSYDIQGEETAPQEIWSPVENVVKLDD